MGNILRSIQGLFGKKDVRVMMIGLDNSGKTTILYRLKLELRVAFVSTIGFFNVETIAFQNFNFTIWEVNNNQKKTSKHFQNTNGVIIVIDSTDRERIHEVEDIIHETVNQWRIVDDKDVVLLILANKMDLLNKMTGEELKSSLRLDSLKCCKW